nr:MAG TPA: hypothetical protein [Caudoviricetes sp.]
MSVVPRRSTTPWSYRTPTAPPSKGPHRPPTGRRRGSSPG